MKKILYFILFLGLITSSLASGQTSVNRVKRDTEALLESSTVDSTNVEELLVEITGLTVSATKDSTTGEENQLDIIGLTVSATEDSITGEENQLDIIGLTVSVAADSVNGEQIEADVAETLTEVGGLTVTATKDSTLQETALDTLTTIHERLIDVEVELADIHDTDLPAVISDTEEIQGDTDALIVDLYSGTRIASTTEDLDQAAGAKTLFTGTTADVILESISLRNANVDCSDDAGAFTGISIETDDVTVTTFISQADGVKANLTEEAQLAWTGSAIIKVNTIITLTIYGDPSDDTCAPDIIVTYRPLGATGTLAP